MRYLPFDKLRILAAAAALTLTALPAPGQEEQKPKLRTVIKAMMHADASEATAVLDLLDVKYGIKDDQNLIVLRGEGYAIDTALKVLDALDEPQPSIELQVFVLSASKEGSTNVPAELSAAVDSLKGVFGYQGFELLDNVLLRVLEGRRGRVDGGIRLGDDDQRTSYSFSFRKATVVPEDELKIRLKDLKFEVVGPRHRPAGSSGGDADSLLASLKTDVQFREGQTAVIGSSTPRGLGETLILMVKSTATKGPEAEDG